MSLLLIWQAAKCFTQSAQGVTVQRGDIVLLRTGYLDMWFQSGDEGYAQPGIGFEAAAWLADRDVVAVGSDNARWK